MKGLNVMEDKTFELIEKMYVEMKNGFNQVNQRFDKVESRLDNVETRLANVEKTTLNIEQDHGKKLQALFDGYKQHSDQLDRVEKEVSMHEEVILRRIK